MYVKLAVHKLLVKPSSFDNGFLSRKLILAPRSSHGGYVGRAEPAVFDCTPIFLGRAFGRPVVVWHVQDNGSTQKQGRGQGGEQLRGRTVVGIWLSG